ncbi:hypothetical protein [Lacibacter sp.]|uniref:hypothetical protein n=1 Tax=Lacibacter sp. TaxID=1915409 RepID=UPI002B4B0EC4|nr:hypothetical protein [Lacibacter sp.]HLP39540.1 hypothetical protein [Lacibacter sp.]
MEEKNDEYILEGLLDVKAERGWMYKAFTVSSLLFILCLSFDLLYDVDGGRMRRTSWDFFLMLVGLPVIGMLFHLAHKKIGWIVNVFYYVVVSLLFSYIFYEEFITRDIFQNGVMLWRVILFLGFSLLSVVLLFSKEMRTYFRVSDVLVIVLSIISIIGGVLLLSTA